MYRSVVPRGVRWATGTALAISLLVRPSLAAPAPPVAQDEAVRLDQGETVTYEQTVEERGHRYVGGLTYTVIDATPAELSRLFEDVGAYRQLLPRTKQARLVGQNAGDFFVELRQGNSLVEASYTIRVHPQVDATTGTAEYRFWLDRSKPHGIDDAWGYFRVQQLSDGASGAPRALLTYGILVDVGPGLVRDLFEGRLRALALTVPQLVRQYALAHFRAGGSA